MERAFLMLSCPWLETILESELRVSTWLVMSEINSEISLSPSPINNAAVPVTKAVLCEVPVIVPNLVFIEIAGAISRRHNDPDGAQRFANSVRDLPNLIVIELEDELAQAALMLAAQRRLRGADAIYAAVAIQQTCFLISLDNEHLTRLVGVVETRTPTDLLTELTPPQDEALPETNLEQ